MIESLRIEDWVIVDEAELEFSPGLNVLTGETGTGKSIVLGALSLLAGGRGSADAVRTGASRASVEAVFRTEHLEALESELARRGLEPDDESGDAHALVVHRTIASSGRSRARVAGELVQVSTLAELLSPRIEISSQHSSQTLLRPDAQGLLLDEAGGLQAARAKVESGVAELRAADAELAALRDQEEERARRQDFLEFQVAEIDEAGLAPGEIEELGALHGRLAHAERILADGGAARAALVGDATDAGAAAGAVDLVGAAQRDVEELAAVDSGLASLAERLQASSIELSDAAADLERYLSNIDADPRELARVEERLATIDALRRKYGADEAEIAAFRERAAAELAAALGADARIEELAARRVDLVGALESDAKKLTQGRVKAARKLGRLVGGSLEGLAMPGAAFEIRLEPVEPPEGLPCRAGGSERAEFLFSGNKGDAPRALSRVASGGELSRIFLAVRNALRKSGGGMVLVFDEVDAGIGGRAAERVGRALAELARHHQVLCITHLPQIAVFGDVHFRVQKREERGRARAEIARVDGDARVDEIARMAGGEDVTKATRKHAASLLESAAARS